MIQRLPLRFIKRNQVSYIAVMASVVHVIVGLGNGGAEKTLRKISSRDKNNFHVIISLTGPGHHAPSLRAAGAHVHCMGLRRWNLVRVLRKMRQLRCLREADVVTAWMPHAILLSPLYCRLSGDSKLVVNLRASSYGGLFVNFFRKLMLVAWSVFFGKLVERVIVPGEITKNAHRGFAVRKANFIVIPNGFSKAKAPSGEEHLPLGSSFFSNRADTPGVLCIGMFARWHPQKNHSGFLKALFLLSNDGVDFRVLMAGANVDWRNRRLARIIKRYSLEDKVELLGGVESIDGLCEFIDLHVVASSYGEAFPNVVAETMLQGVPNIATNIGDSAKVIGSTGWLVEPRRPLALYRALKEAHGSEADLRSKGELAAKRISNFFPVDQMVSQYSSLYSQLSSLDPRAF